MAPINVGLTGYSGSAKYFHLPFITPNPDLEVVAFLQRAEAPKDKSNVEPGTHCTVDYPKAKHHRNADEFFANPEIELVVVCTASATHFDFGQRALKAGKHGSSSSPLILNPKCKTTVLTKSVVVEKPFTVTSSEATQLINLSKETGKLLTVYQNRRYDSDFRTLQHLMSLNPNPFGKITEFENHYDMPAPWIEKWGSKTPAEAPGEGMLYALGTHSIDQALQLFGRPKSVTAFLRVLRDGGKDGAVDDAFTIVLQYDGAQKDLIVTIKTTIVTPMAKQVKYWLRGTDGSFFKVRSRSSHSAIY